MNSDIPPIEQFQKPASDAQLANHLLVDMADPLQAKIGQPILPINMEGANDGAFSERGFLNFDNIFAAQDNQGSNYWRQFPRDGFPAGQNTHLDDWGQVGVDPIDGAPALTPSVVVTGDGSVPQTVGEGSTAAAPILAGEGGAGLAGPSDAGDVSPGTMPGREITTSDRGSLLGQITQDMQQLTEVELSLISTELQTIDLELTQISAVLNNMIGSQSGSPPESIGGRAPSGPTDGSGTTPSSPTDGTGTTPSGPTDGTGTTPSGPTDGTGTAPTDGSGTSTSSPTDGGGTTSSGPADGGSTSSGPIDGSGSSSSSPTDGTGGSAGTPPGLDLSGNFSVKDGKIIAPNGQVFEAKGLNLAGPDADDDEQAILKNFPGLNFIRLNVGPDSSFGSGGDNAYYSTDSTSQIQQFINTMTAHGIVVEVENHDESSGPIGSEVTNEDNWISTIAAQNKDNPYVWFGSANEPKDALSDAVNEEQQFYNVVRGTGNNNMIMLEEYVAGPVAETFTDNPNLKNYTNVAIDAHTYDVSASGLTSWVNGFRGIDSADGQMPVILGEFGAADDNSSGVNGVEAVENAVNSGQVSGAVGWELGHYNLAQAPLTIATAGDDTNGSQQDITLTGWGQQLANWIDSGEVSSFTPPS